MTATALFDFRLRRLFRCCAIALKIFSAICSAAFGACHCASADCIFERTASFSINSVKIAATFSGVEFFCSSNFAAPVFSNAQRVEKLVIVRRRRKRHEQRRQPHRGNFRERRRAGTADGNCRRAERQIHFGKKRFDDGFEFLRGVSGFHFFKIVRAGQMQPLPVFFARATAARTKSFRSSRSRPGCRRRPELSEDLDRDQAAIADWRRFADVRTSPLKIAGRTGVPVTETFSRFQSRGGFWKSDERLVHKSREKTVGAAGNGVGFVQKSFRAEFSARREPAARW